MQRLAMRMDSQLSCLWVYDENENIISYGLPEEETKSFKELLESVEKRFSVEAMCGEYYEELGFENQQEKDELIADAFKLLDEVKKHLSDRYRIDEKPDLSMVYDTPAGKREELRKAYEKV